MIFFRSFQASAILALLSLVIVVISITSYGSKASVWLSWTGMTLGSSVFKTDTNNGGTLTPTPTVAAGWISDKKFIMWKEGTFSAAVTSDFSKWSQGNQNGYDKNYIMASILTISSTTI